MAAPLHIVHGVLALDVGGLERLVLDLIRAAAGAGHRVTVVSVERPGKLAPEAEAAGARVVSLDKPFGRHPGFIGRAAEALAGLRPDVVHTHQITAAYYLGPAARRLTPPAPVVHTEHGNHFRQAGGWRALAKRRLATRAAARLIDRFCCVSAEIAAAAGRWWTVPRGKLEVVPNGITTDPPADLKPPGAVRESLGIPADAAVVGTVGRLAEVKRQDILIRALRLLAADRPAARLVIVGDGPERPKLDALAAGLGLADRVRFAGYQPRPDEYLRAMDVFSLTSRSEGFPVSLLEAWRAGAAVAAAAVGGIPAVVADGADGLLFPPGDPAAAAAAIGRLLDDPALRGRLARAGRATLADRYSLDRMAAEYERRYRELIADRTAGKKEV
jgi:glycosyltransferase involved in cell wall biosynthesis